jgi:competence protein ComEA
VSIRLPPGWPRLAALVVPPALAAGVLAAIALANAGSGLSAAAANLPAAVLAPPVAPGLLVYVSGAVTRPGLYRLQRGDRAFDAIAAAGGFSPDADPTRMPDLAARLKDGMQIKVPFRKGAGGGVTGGKVDLNLATLSDLEQVPGFTPALAQAAITYRDAYGGFATTRELVSVLGMSEAAYLVARPYVKV